MNFEGIKFPLYRKYKNSKSYFKILGPEVFQEIKLFGSRYAISHFEAKIYPDRLFIHDLVSNEELTSNIAAEEFEALLAKALAE
jgi:hypothetical protein